MKCPKCNGKGAFFNEVYNDGKRRREILIKCNKCNGTGYVDMTNDEWRRTCSMEDFAKWIYHERCKYSDGWYEQCGHTAEEVKEWLKEEHNDSM